MSVGYSAAYERDAGISSESTATTCTIENDFLSPPDEAGDEKRRPER
jgi:hypothetical protein